MGFCIKLSFFQILLCPDLLGHTILKFFLKFLLKGSNDHCSSKSKIFQLPLLRFRFFSLPLSLPIICVFQLSVPLLTSDSNFHCKIKLCGFNDRNLCIIYGRRPKRICNLNCMFLVVYCIQGKLMQDVLVQTLNTTTHTI